MKVVATRMRKLDLFPYMYSDFCCCYADASLRIVVAIFILCKMECKIMGKQYIKCTYLLDKLNFLRQYKLLALIRLTPQSYDIVGKKREEELAKTI